MSIDRRDLLKVFSTAAAGAALDGLLAEEMLPQATAPRRHAFLSNILLRHRPMRSVAIPMSS